jgi:hypothetical protein
MSPFFLLFRSDVGVCRVVGGGAPRHTRHSQSADRQQRHRRREENALVSVFSLLLLFSLLTKGVRSVRQWAYETFGNDRAVSFVAMATPEDLNANAEYIRMADHFVPVAGGSNNHNYANVDLIVDVAERTQVDAVWAGWGHASENPEVRLFRGKRSRFSLTSQ